MAAGRWGPLRFECCIDAHGALRRNQDEILTNRFNI